MKRLFLSGLILFMCATSLSAQDCKMCGDWIGTYSIIVPSEDEFTRDMRKMHIRILQHGDDISVRVKHYSVDEPDKITYWNDCRISSISEEFISFSTFVADSFDWSSSDKKNGRTISKASYWNICTLTYKQGVLILSNYLYTEYYDGSGNIIGTHNNPISTVPLYQDDDW